MRTLRGSCSLRQSLLFRLRGLLLQAGCASPEDLKGVPRRAKPELMANSALHVFQFRHKELYGVAARGANHVMVRSAIQAEFVARDPIVKIDLISEAALSKEFQGTIHSRIADAGIALSYQPMQLLGTEMVARRQKHVENAVALAALLESFVAEMYGEDASGLPDQILAIWMHFIDAFLHCGAQGFL